MPISLHRATGTDKFRGSADSLMQEVEVKVLGAQPGALVTVSGPDGEFSSSTDGDGLARVTLGLVHPEDPSVTARDIQLEISSGDERLTVVVGVEVGQPGWTVYLAPHFHYDPVWWNTQAAFVSEWENLPVAATGRGMPSQLDVFELMRLHLDRARLDPDYKFVVAELDYLKPWWSAHPHEREWFRELLRTGRIELAGGTYNEPSTTLITAEATIRNAMYGAAFQRDVLGGDPTTAWQLDVFGHDPQFPGLMAAAGLTRTSWARGPFHEWGPMGAAGGRPVMADPVGMQFESEFEWMSPNGVGILTSYMPAHYSAGWWMDDAPSLEAAEDEIYELFHNLRSSSTTRNVLIPVGTDHTRPNRWVTDIHRHWAEEYVWPRMVVATPSEYFGAVERDLASAKRPVTTQTRDMNPVFGGTNTSYADTKQAHRAAENLLADAEKFAALAAALGLDRYPHEELDAAWRQISFASHHDAITGSESDQVYVDLLGSWRDAWTRASQVHARATRALSGTGENLTVFNAVSSDRTDVVQVALPHRPGGVRTLDGEPVPAVVSGSDETGWALAFVARDVPATGHATYTLDGAGIDEWTPVEAAHIANEHYRLAVDLARGGVVSSLVEAATGRELIASDEAGNEILIFDEYANHPKFGELGPWYIMTKGDAVLRSSAATQTSVSTLRSPAGERIEVSASLGDLRYRQVITLWNGVNRVECALHLENFAGSDQLVRVAWPVDIAGTLPVADVAGAVIGRGFAHPRSDAAEFPWSLDAPCHQWFGLSSPARLRVRDGDRMHVQVIATAEIISRSRDESATSGRVLAQALVRCGVTSTNSTVDAPRYGDLDNDSNLPDFRIAFGDASSSPFIAEVLEAADPWFRERLESMSSGLLFVPAARPTRSAFEPGAKVTAADDLPVLIVTGDVQAAVDALVADLADASIEVEQPHDLLGEQRYDDHSVAIVNSGTPGYTVDTSGTLYLSLMRSSTGWPSGVWIDPPVRTTPDRTAFQLQHWTHEFDYSVVSGAGDWREAGFAMHGLAVNHPLTAVAGSARAAARSLLRVEPQGQVFASALKIAGNPLASGSPVDDAASALTLRLFESSGAAAEAVATFETAVRSYADSDLLERSARDNSVATARIGAFDTATRRVELESYRPASGSSVATTTFSRYWLHNTGAAPTGNQPVSVGIRHRGGSSDGKMNVTITVARETAAAVTEGELRVAVTGGGELVGAAVHPIALSDEYVDVQCEIALVDADSSTLVAVVATFANKSGEVFDAIVIEPRVPEPLSSIPLAPLVTATWSAPGLELARGRADSQVLTLTSAAPFDIRGEVQLLSPWGSWGWLDDWKVPFALSAGETADVAFAFTPPADTPPGTTWAIAKVMWFGSIAYTDTVPVIVT